MRVFISHKKEDVLLAAHIGRYLTARGVHIYLDAIDAQLGKDGPDLADYLRLQLDGCSHLLAVLTAKSGASWWIPWEIGVATEKERFLASFLSGVKAVPEFLEKWPYLASDEDLDQYLQESRSARTLEEASISRGAGRTAARKSAFKDFHRGLKRRLNQ